MKLKLLALASIISTTGVYASLDSCCNEVRSQIGFNSNCDSELNLAQVIGSELSYKVRTQFGISSETKRLPVPKETHAGNPTRPNSKQNFGYILTPSADSTLKSVIGVYKNTDASGTTCVGVDYDVLDQSYTKFRNLDRIAEQKNLGSIDINSCLVYIEGLSNVLNLQYTSALERELKKKGINLLASHQRSSAKVNITLPYLNYMGTQRDINFQLDTRRNGKRVASYDFNMSMYYKNSGTISPRTKIAYDITNIFDMDLMDYTVLTKAISDGIDVNRCRRSR